MSDNESAIRVLIVEDEQRLREGLLRAIPAMGFTPIGAASGETGLQIMQQEPCDVILLDLNLPDMSGIALFEKVRATWPATQVVIVTGYGDLDSAKQAVHLDAVEFLTKPCTLAELEEAIGRACQRRYEFERLSPVVDSASLGAGADEKIMKQSPSGSNDQTHLKTNISTSMQGENGIEDQDNVNQETDEKADAPKSLQELEREHILAALERNHGNRTAAAVELGISRRTLHYRIREYQRLGLMAED